MTTGVDDAIHIQIQIVKFDVIRIWPARIGRHCISIFIFGHLKKNKIKFLSDISIILV